MQNNICNSCGANLIYKDGRWVCPACGLTRAEDISNEESTLLYNALQKLRMASFDDAEDAYRDIVDKYPKNSEARWGLVLAKYGIKYEDDYDGRRLPTCYATSIESVLTDKDYLAAVDLCADASRRAYYVEQGKLIEKIRIEWLEKASQEPQYDVFLCFKDSDKANNMERTDDSIEVSNLYTHLTELGYHVFYSRVSLRDKVSEKYEPYIYNALNTASVMIVYGSRIEYFTSVWMKNEWTRFFKRMRDGLKVEGSLVVACEGVNPAELPKPLNAMQVMDATSKTFYGDLERHIEKVISIAKRPKATVDRIEISGAIGKKKTSIGNEIKTIKIGGDNIVKKKTVVLDSAVTVREIGQYEVPALTADENVRLKNIYRSIENGFFDNAGKAVAEVLAKNKFSSQALLASLLVHYEARSLDDLRTKMTEVDDFKLIHTVIEYNEKDIGESIIAILCDLIRLAIANGEYDKAVSYLKEVIVYNSNSVSALKTELRPIATKLLTASSEASEQIYDVLVGAYQDADSYIDYLQEYVNDCLKSGNFSIAKKYNNRVVELDDGNLPATLAEMYIEVSAKNFDDFCRLADEFDNFSYLDHAIGHFDEGEIAECFEKVQQIFFRAIQLQLSGDTICRWFDFIAKYEFVGRNDFLAKATAALTSIEDTVSRSSLFDRVVKCIDGNDVETHINMRLDFAKRLQVTGEFSLAINYYKQVLDIEEGNVSALWGIILCLCEANRETDISDRIDRFTYFTELENLLKYCPDLATRTEYLNKILNAVIFKAGTLSNKEHMVKLSKVLEGTIKYYPEDGNAQLIQYIRKFADCCKNNSVFDLAEKYYATILTLDKMQHSAYWGLLQVKLKCRNNDDLIKQPTLITETSEFNSAVSAAGDDDRSAEKYFSVARNQKDYLEEQEKKAAAAKKRKRKIRFASGIAAVLAVVCLIGFVAFKYISIESALKYDDGVGGYTVTTGKFFKEGSVIIPEIYDGKPVTKIADGAFEGNTYLTSVTIPSTVTEIGENAFKGCTNLREIAFANVKPNASLQANARFAYAGTYTLSVGTPTYTLTNTSNQKITTVQSGVKKIGAKAFYGCTNLASIDASRATEIGEEAFAGCSSLHSIVFGNNLLSLSNGTFSGCSSLKLVDLPSSLTTIGDRCFENCTGFTNFLVPATITTVGDAILTGCANLTELVVEERSTMEGFSQNWKNGVPDTVKTSIGFRIALDYNHATISGKDAVSVKQDGGYQLPLPERTGYKFLGWYDSMTNGNRLTDENGQSLSAYAFGRSVTVYALWEANINEVVFMPNGGEGDPFTQEIATDASAALSKNTFTKKGYTFAGWGTTTYSVNYTDEAEYVMGSNSTYTLYAIWKANENTLHFDSNGGNGGSMSDMKIASDAKATLLKNGFTRSGYEFAGWAESANGSKVYSDGENYSMGLESSYTLYALWKPKTYSITYKLNGGQTSESNKISYDIESDSFSLVNPVREGYIFVGWSGTGLDGNENLSVSVSTGTYGDLTFTANWKAIEYQITYDLDGGQNNSGNPGTYTIEQLITLLPPTKTGYTFKGWSDGGVIAKGSTGEKTFTATWEISGYKINYNLNGGINHPSNPDEYNVDNDTITLKEPTRVGYTFKGWSDGGVIEHGSTGVKTFTASWEVITYKITYILGGGVNAPENSGTYTVEDVITLVSPTKTGYRFDGWSNGGLIEKGSTGDKEFTATWSIIDYKISYELNGGTNHAKNPESYTVNSADITLNEPTRPGYRFVGWSDGGTIPHGSTGDKTFVAQWEANSNTIKYDPNGGNGTMSDSIMHTDESTKLSQNTYARTGYVFAGWATEQGGVVQYKDESLYTMGAESEVILYAVWTPVTYRISYDLAGGNETSNPGEYNIETDDITLVIPTRPGYTFTGWSGTGIDGKQKLVTISKGSIGERQYTANWEANSNKIIFDPNGGSGTMPVQEIKTNESGKLSLNAFTALGCKFLGWALSPEGDIVYQDGDTFHMGTEPSYTLYAIWDVTDYPISYQLNGGTVSGNPIKYTALTKTFTLIHPTRPGYTFIGWSGTDIEGLSMTVTVTRGTVGNREYVAHWKANTNTVTFHPNGGSGSMSAQEICTDASAALAKNLFSRAGYTFIGWSTSPAGAVEYVDQAQYAMETESNYDLYAVWKANDNTLVLNGNTSTSGSMSSQTMATDSKGNLPKNTYQKTGYTFIGWATTPDGAVVYLDGAEYTMGTDAIVTLYAVWEANSYKVILNPENGGKQGEATVRYDQNFALTVPTREGYIFDGWFLKVGGNGDRLTDKDGKSVSVWKVGNDVTVYASWLGTAGLVYSENGDSYTLTGVTDKNMDSAYIPEYYNGKPVTVIAENAFAGCTALTYIHATPMIERIGHGAFAGCSSLSSLTLPFVGSSRTATEAEGLLTYWFGTASAEGCEEIWQYYLNADGYDESSSAFIPSSLHTITLTDATRIPYGAFAYATMLTSVDLGEVSVIEARAFEYAMEIQTITLPETLTTIGDFAFAHTSVSSFIIPGSVNEIGRAILAGCTKLRALTIPYVGKTISAEGEEAKLGYFFGTSSYNGTEAVTQNGTTYYVPTALVKVVVTKAIKIGDFAFYGMKNLTEIVLPDTVETIGTSAFVSCSKLERMTLNNVTVIGSSAFQGCTSLKAVTFGNKLKTIGGAAFASTNLQTVDLPSTVTEIGVNAFNGISNLRTIIVRTTGTVLTYNTSMFTGCSAYAKVFVPDELLSSYKSKWSQLGADKFYGLSIVKNNGMAISGTTLVQYFGTNESVTIPSNVTMILPYAFYGNAFVRSVVIPGSVETISTYAFAGCSALETVRMNTGVRNVDASAFAGCEKMTTVFFPATLATIGNNAFDGCTGITSLTLPSNLETIGNYAFKNVQITTIVVPKSVTSIGTGAFQGCPPESITLPFVGNADGSSNRVWYIFGSSIDSLPDTLRSVSITNATVIPASAFYGCTKIENITINDGVSSIGGSAFYECIALKSMKVPASVKTIGSYAWYNCTSITEIKLSNLTVLSESILQGCSSLENIVLPSTLVRISKNAFCDCINLKTIRIPNAVVNIDERAFANCSMLTTVSFSSELTSIGSYAFSKCKSLSQLTLPSKIESIEIYAFEFCESLETIIVPNSVTTIGYGVFKGCKSLKELSLPYCGSARETVKDENDAYTITSDTFKLSNGKWYSSRSGALTFTALERVTVTFSGWVSNNSASYLYVYRNSEVAGNMICYISETSQQHTYSVTLSKGETLLFNANNYANIQFDSVVYAGDGAFGTLFGSVSCDGCDAVKQNGGTYYIPSSIRKVTITKQDYIPDYAFANCTFIEDILLNNNTSTIGSYAFYGCSSLKSMLFPTGIAEIGSYAFYGCVDITSLVLPGILTINDYTFYGCSSLETITLSESLSQIGDYSFAGCTKLLSVKIPNTVESLGKYAFSGCTKLSTVTLPSMLISIGNYAFSNCKSISKILLPETMISIGNCAFENCKELVSIVVPNSVSTIGYSVFKGCTSLKELTLPYCGKASEVSKNEKDAYDLSNSGFSDTGGEWFTRTSGATISITAKEYITVSFSVKFSHTYSNFVTVSRNGVVYSKIYYNQLSDIYTITLLPGDVLNFKTSIQYSGDYVTIQIVSVTYAGNSTFGSLFGSASCDGCNAVIQNGGTYYIPSSIRKVTITKQDYIPDYAFANCTFIEDIILNDSTSTIGSYAFYGCSILKGMKVPTTVATIGSYAWYNCSGMTSIQLPNVTELSDYLLYGCSKLTEVVIPDSVTKIGAHAFDGCTGITLLTIPDQVQTIEAYTFYGCTGIKTVRLSVNLKSIGSNAFYGCTGITALTLPSKLETIGGGAFQGTRLKNIIIPQGVTIINSNTFFDCKCLESIVIPSTIQSIGSQAFYNCMKLKIVIVENGNVMSLTALNSTNVFDGCNTSLCIIVPKDAYQAYKSASNWSSYASKIYSDENVVEGKFLIVDGVLKQYWGTDAEVTIPDSVTSIGDYAFAYNTTVKKVTWNGQLKQIGNYAFADCVALTTINSSVAGTFDLGTGLTTIGQYAFSNCTGAKSIVVRETVTSIGYAAFMGCANLSEITLPFVGMDNTASYNQNQVFGYIFGYNTTAGDDRVMQYNGYYYYIPKTLKSVTITSEKVIGKNAFINCDMLESITIQGDVESIGDYAFYSCSNLKSITVLTTTVPTLSSYALNSDSAAVIYVKADMVEQFKAATGWKDFTIQAVQ